jgi:glucosamine-phosphate N-acetyltransferase
MDGELPEYQIRELTAENLERNFPSFCKTLEHLAPVDGLNSQEAATYLSEMNSQNAHVYVAQIGEGEIIGVATLLIERKMIHNGGLVGHVEDVAARKEYKGMGIGKRIMAHLIEEAEGRFGCYKTILDCSIENTGFYNKLGFYLKEMCMRKDPKPS